MTGVRPAPIRTGSVPLRVAAARGHAEETSFEYSCDDGVGRLLALLVAGVPHAGRVLETGTGAGVGLAWLLHGLAGRDDVSVVTVDIDSEVSGATRDSQDWPRNVAFEVGDDVEVLRRRRGWDLVFADSPGVKFGAVADAVDSLTAGGLLVLDDMGACEGESRSGVMGTLLGDPRLLIAECADLTGVVIARRVWDAGPAPSSP